MQCKEEIRAHLSRYEARAKKNKLLAGTRVWTTDQTNCNRPLYHWAIPAVNTLFVLIVVIGSWFCRWVFITRRGIREIVADDCPKRKLISVQPSNKFQVSRCQAATMKYTFHLSSRRPSQRGSHASSKRILLYLLVLVWLHVFCLVACGLSLRNKSQDHQWSNKNSCEHVSSCKESP